MTSTSSEEFAAVLGVTIRRVEPDGKCATYDRYNRIAYICRNCCMGRDSVIEALLERIA